MPLWKNSDSTSDDAKPKFITLDPNIDARDVIATNQGWVHRKTYTDQHGNSRTKDEILVAIRQLAGDAAGGKLAEATIVDVRWSALQVAAGGVARSAKGPGRRQGRHYRHCSCLAASRFDHRCSGRTA